MEETNKIKLFYNNKSKDLVLPEKYKDFLKLLEDTFYLTPELLEKATISYLDSEGYENMIDDENSYNDSLNEHAGKWEMRIDFFSTQDNPDINLENKPNKEINTVINQKKIDKNEIKDIEKKIAKKYSKIIENKLKQKESEHKEEISKITSDFKNTMNSIIQINEENYNNLSQYYNGKMKEYFQKYNDLVIENLNKGISQSELKDLAEQFFKDNQLPDVNNNQINNNDDNDNDNGNSFVFSKLINK